MKVYDSDHIRNVALVGHSGAGKTQLASALLFDSVRALSRQPGDLTGAFKQGVQRHIGMLIFVHTVPHFRRRSVLRTIVAPFPGLLCSSVTMRHGKGAGHRADIALREKTGKTLSQSFPNASPPLQSCL